MMMMLKETLVVCGVLLATASVRVEATLVDPRSVEIKNKYSQTGNFHYVPPERGFFDEGGSQGSKFKYFPQIENQYDGNNGGGGDSRLLKQGEPNEGNGYQEWTNKESGSNFASNQFGNTNSYISSSNPNNNNRFEPKGQQYTPSQSEEVQINTFSSNPENAFASTAQQPESTDTPSQPEQVQIDPSAINGGYGFTGQEVNLSQYQRQAKEKFGSHAEGEGVGTYEQLGGVGYEVRSQGERYSLGNEGMPDIPRKVLSESGNHGESASAGDMEFGNGNQYTSPKPAPTSPPKSNRFSSLPKPTSKLEFIHITKTGGSAVEAAAASHGIMWGACHYWKIKYEGCETPDWEMPQRRNNDLIPDGLKYQGEPWHAPPNWNVPNPMEDADKFLIVRNPYNRIISEYYCSSFGYRGDDIEDVEAFNNWLAGNLTSLSEKLQGHMLPQHLYVYDLEGNELVQHILRYENLKEEFDALMELYDLPVRMPEKNAKSVHHIYKQKKNLRGSDPPKLMTVNDISPENVQKINEIYAKDFKIFGYPMIPASYLSKEQGNASARDH